MKRSHSMPFGAEMLQDGRVCFQLWAPAASTVELCLSSDHGSASTATLAMNAEEDGWFRLLTDRAAAGSRYYYRIDGDKQVPDPASRFQPEDVHGPSEVVDACAWTWQDAGWRGRPWEEAVLYELHVGSFTPDGTFAAVQQQLDYLVELGVTAIELMPVADFPGRRNWGYDGAYLFAPDSRYGRPADLKALIDAAHARGLMVFLDVVYNHFGPEGNYLHLYAPGFFTERHHTPWGAAIDFDGEHSGIVRQFFLHNTLYWLEEYHLDGLRLDAVHAIVDDSRPHILTELAGRVQTHFGDGRHIHLVLENDHNESRYLARNSDASPRWYAAQWNDDFHHVAHVLLAGESFGYYQDYIDEPVRYLARCLEEGFAYQGEPSRYRDNRPRGEPSDHLPPTAFVAFLQNHDQVGNRAFGERLTTLAKPEPRRAAVILLLLGPSPPLLFMGEEWACERPFPFFCDFGPDLAEQVIEGRRQEFARFPQFRDAQSRERIPDPMDPATFEQTLLDWEVREEAAHRCWLDLYRELIALRRRELMPRLHCGATPFRSAARVGQHALSVRWTLTDGSELALLANLHEEAAADFSPPADNLLYSTHNERFARGAPDHLPAWSVFWYLHDAGAGP